MRHDRVPQTHCREKLRQVREVPYAALQRLMEKNVLIGYKVTLTPPPPPPPPEHNSPITVPAT